MSQDVNQSASTSSISTKLIAGAILGLSIGLIGLFQGLQSGDKAREQHSGSEQCDFSS
jgi:hypothetical protein